MSKFRVLCGSCESSFCANCRADPYHMGKTCEELKEQLEVTKCRFCRMIIIKAQENAKEAFKEVCGDPACQELMNNSCDKVLECGHACHGYHGEKKCLPCLAETCVDLKPEETHFENSESYCAMCNVCELGQQPCVQLECNHVFHVDCLINCLELRWPGPRITFLYAACPHCKAKAFVKDHQRIQELTVEASKLQQRLLGKSNPVILFR